MNGRFQDRRLRRGHLGQREEPLAGGASEKVGQHHAGVFSDAYRSLDFMLQAKKKKIQMNSFTRQKRNHRPRKQTYVCYQRGKREIG